MCQEKTNSKKGHSEKCPGMFILGLFGTADSAGHGGGNFGQRKVPSEPGVDVIINSILAQNKEDFTGRTFVFVHPAERAFAVAILRNFVLESLP